MPGLNPDLSVVVATFNRASKLSGTLDGLAAMVIPPGVSWELIVVDNNSTDDTSEVIHEFARNASFPVHYVFERNQGLAHARNAGCLRSSGDIVAMTDDDCIPDQNWLGAIWEEFRRDSLLALVGGRVELHNELDLPMTLRTSRAPALLSPLALFSSIAGCNFAFRRNLADAIGLFDVDFGAGAPLVSAEDVDFIYRAFKGGYKVAYSPNVPVYHDHGRRTKTDADKLSRLYVMGRGALYMKHLARNDRMILQLLYWELRSMLGEAIKDLSAITRAGHLIRGMVAYPLVRLRGQKIPS